MWRMCHVWLYKMIQQEIRAILLETTESERNEKQTNCLETTENWAEGNL